MGASRLQPVITRHTQVGRVNLERMRANAIEAAQQCGVLALPEVAEPADFARWRSQRPNALAGVLRRGCRGAGSGGGAAARQASALLPGVAAAGRADRPGRRLREEERAALLKRANVLRLSLGPRILRADTAAVAALALVQAVLGDWRGG